MHSPCHQNLSSHMNLPKDLTDVLVYAPKKLRQTAPPSPQFPQQRQKKSQRPPSPYQRALSKDPLSTLSYATLALFLLAQVVLWLMFR
jgi:hypothetical protein